MRIAHIFDMNILISQPTNFSPVPPCLARSLHSATLTVALHVPALFSPGTTHFEHRIHSQDPFSEPVPETLLALFTLN